MSGVGNLCANAHCRASLLTFQISSVSSGTEQMEMIKSAMAEIGVWSAGAGGGDSQEVEEDEVIPEHDIGFIPASDNSIPQSALVGTSFVSLLGKSNSLEFRFKWSYTVL